MFVFDGFENVVERPRHFIFVRIVLFFPVLINSRVKPILIINSAIREFRSNLEEIKKNRPDSRKLQHENAIRIIYFFADWRIESILNRKHCNYRTELI